MLSVRNCLETIKDAHRNGAEETEEVSLEASAISGSLNSPKFYYKVRVVYSVMSYDKTMKVEE